MSVEYRIPKKIQGGNCENSARFSAAPKSTDCLIKDPSLSFANNRQKTPHPPQYPPFKPLQKYSENPCFLTQLLFKLSKETEVDDVLDHLGQTYPHYLRDKNLMAKMADYLADKRGSLEVTKTFSPEVEARNARILAEAIRNQKL